MGPTSSNDDVPSVEDLQGKDVTHNEGMTTNEATGETVAPSEAVTPGVSDIEMPMPGGEAQKELIEAVESNMSLYGLYLELPRLAQELQTNALMRKHGFSVVDTVRALDDTSRAMWELLHSMPHDVVKSIVRGSVAYDIHHNRFPCYTTPPRNNIKVPGVYVVSLARHRDGPRAGDPYDGQFLNTQELNLLIDGIQEYIKGYKVHCKLEESKTHGVAISVQNLPPDEVSAYKHLREVDGYSRAKSYTSPIFMYKENHISNMEALIATFKRMCSADNSVRAKQGPLYVGCSVDLGRRTSVYGQQSVKDINKPLGLTLAVLRKLDLGVKVNVKVVLRTWKAGQVPLAEQLVTTIAGSLVYQHGFNAIEAGGTGPDTKVSIEELKANERYIMSTMNAMRNNLKMTIQDIESRQGFLETFDTVQSEAQEIAKTIHDCEKTLANLPKNTQWDTNVSSLQEILSRLKEDLKEREKVLQFWDFILEVQRRLKGEVNLI